MSRISAKTIVNHNDRLALRHTAGNRCSQDNEDQSSYKRDQSDPTKSQRGQLRSQTAIENQHHCIETSQWRSNNEADDLRLTKGHATYHEVKRIIHKHTPGSFLRDKNSLGQEILKIMLRDENSLRQQTQKGVLKDGKSLRYEALKETYVRNPTSSMNIRVWMRTITTQAAWPWRSSWTTSTVKIRQWWSL